MPRIVFETLDELGEWIDKKATPEKYDVYVTRDEEIIFVPLRSTQPILYGYLKGGFRKDVDKILEESKTSGYKVFVCKDFEWNADRYVGMKFPVE